MSKDNMLRLAVTTVVLAVSAHTVPASQPVGPFTVKLQLSHMPKIGEEVAVICSISSVLDLDSSRVSLWTYDTIGVEIIEGQDTEYCSFEKHKIKGFRWVVVFRKAKLFHLVAHVMRFHPRDGNYDEIFLQTHEDRKAEILKRPPSTWRRDPNRKWGRSTQDSLKAWRKRGRELREQGGSDSFVSQPAGPFEVIRLNISHMPRLNEEVALVCSVTASLAVEKALIAFWIEDTLNVRITGGQKEWEGSFKKGETKEFKLTISFQSEGVFGLGAIAQAIFKGGRSANTDGLQVKTYQNRPGELLVQKYPKPPPAWVIWERIKARMDSLRNVMEPKKEK